MVAEQRVANIRVSSFPIYRVYAGLASGGARANRSELDECLGYLRDGANLSSHPSSGLRDE